MLWYSTERRKKRYFSYVLNTVSTHHHLGNETNLKPARVHSPYYSTRSCLWWMVTLKMRCECYLSSFSSLQTRYIAEHTEHVSEIGKEIRNMYHCWGLTEDRNGFSEKLHHICMDWNRQDIEHKQLSCHKGWCVLFILDYGLVEYHSIVLHYLNYEEDKWTVPLTWCRTHVQSDRWNESSVLESICT